MKKYIVRPGDTLYAISKRTGVRLQLLLAANPQIQNPNFLMPGMSMVIPELGKPAKKSVGNTLKSDAQGTKKTKTGSMSQASKTPTPPYFGFVWPHVVKKGDTIEKIAKKYGVSMEHLMHLNAAHHESQALKPGSIVYVPSVGIPNQGMPMQNMPNQGMPMQNMPNQGMPMQNMPNQGMPMQQTSDTEGPHTHHPYRPRKKYRDVRSAANSDIYGMQVPPSWDTEIDESSSLLSSWEDWDDAMRGQMHVSSVQSDKSTTSFAESGNEEGWSQTISLQDEDIDPEQNG